MQKNNLAAIDLGTNSCRIYIADENGKELFRDGQSVKLGDGLGKSMCFTSDAIERTVNCLFNFNELMSTFNVKKYRTIATAACRMAQNSRELINTVKEKCGITIEIINPREEALLNLRGARLNADKHKKYVLVYDLGGGSTEITLATNEEKPQIIHTLSIPLGARNAAEIYHLTEYDAIKAKKLRDEIEKYTLKFIKESKFTEYLSQCDCISTSSTPLRLASMALNTVIYDKELIDGYALEISRFEEQITEIYKATLSDLQENKYVGKNRAPIIVAACVIFQKIYKDLRLLRLTVSLKGAQEAIIEDLLQNDKAN